MRTKLSLSLVFITLIPLLLKAEWISLDKQNKAPASPVATLISDDNIATVIKIEISGFELQDFVSGYQKIDLFSESFTTNPGFPELPYIAKVLAVPDQACVSVEVLETGEVQTFDNIKLSPARKSWLEGSPETPYTENTAAYNSMNSWPADYVQIDPPSIFRDFRISRVAIYPLRYIAATKQLQVVSSITVRVNYSPGEAVNPKTNPKKPIASSFGKLYQSTIFNYQSVLNNLYGGKEEGHELMLCIMPDIFSGSFQAYADWKRQSGIDIHVTKFSDIGANASDPDIIKNYIADAYHNWEVPPTYVLIVGDDGVFPKKIVNYGWSFPNEDYFVEIDGDDFFPEMMIGRLTNQTDYGLQIMLNKFQMYEQTPYTTNTDWFKKGICCSNDAYPSQVETKRYAADRMLLDGGFTSVDTMMSKTPCQYDVSDVVNALNDGRSFLNYRGEGWSSGWWASCTPMSTSNVSSLNNGQKFTFVTSIGCGVAMFDASGGNCFGEEWIEEGTLSNPKGAAAFIGPTSNTHTAYNNNIDRGIYKGMFQEGLETPGEGLLRGKLFMYNVFGSDPYVEYHYRIYCVLGDPSIHIWKDVPQTVTVDAPPSIPFGFNTVEFTVNFASNAQPVANALVCVTGDTLFATGVTDASGHAYVDVDAEELETLYYTIRGGNVYPLEGSFVVIQPNGPYVMKDSYEIDDNLGGNGDGFMDYGETNMLSIAMHNVGVQQANNVLVTLSTENQFITVTDSTENYGNIPADSTAIVADGFTYSVADSIPDQTPVLFQIDATNGSDTWVSYLSITAHAPILEYLDYAIADPTGNNNGKLDPGETVNLTVNIENSGTSTALNVLGTLTESDPFVTINSPPMSFGDVDGGEEASAVFSVSAATNTPAGYPANLGLDLDADLGISGVGDIDMIIGQVPVLILDLDENGNSAPDMETALSSMDVTYEVLSSFPSNLNLYATIFVCLGIYPDNHVLTSTEGQNLADFLNNGGSLYMEGGDTWYFDSSTPVHSMFNINATSDGSADMSTVVGQDGTFTEGMSFNYNGDNGWMDHIEPISPAFKIFDNQSPQYGTGVAYNAGNYKTIGTSHEFGGLQDGTSPSTKAELMTDYLEFFGISNTLQATFSSNVTEVCAPGIVEFYDLSSGDVTSWNWTFEGGDPPTSTVQNPLAAYFEAGNYDVTLTISDGTDTSTLVLNDYITVNTEPGIPPIPGGPTQVCVNSGNTSYSTGGLTGISVYDWSLEPSEAGNATGTGLSATVEWMEGFLGDATLKVAGVNDCGTGQYSAALNISRYLPEVTLEPLGMVCIGWPAFELTGGMPEGGVYSGAGVDNGWFDPAVAGLGMHPITYTFTDPNNCENFAVDSIYVDPCTGIDENSDLSGIRIYPNPTTGKITLGFDKDPGTLGIKVINTLDKVVYSAAEKTNGGNDLHIDLSGLGTGIYFIQLNTGKSEHTLKIILQ